MLISVVSASTDPASVEQRLIGYRQDATFHLRFSFSFRRENGGRRRKRQGLVFDGM